MQQLNLHANNVCLTHTRDNARFIELAGDTAPKGLRQQPEAVLSAMLFADSNSSIPDKFSSVRHLRS